MKIINALLVAILLFFSSCHKNEIDIPYQLLINGTMELGTSTQPESWYVSHDTANINMSWTTAVSSSPAHSLDMSCTTATSTGFAVWGQKYQGAIPVGKDLIFSVKIKGVNLQGDGVSIAIRTDELTANGTYTTDQFVTTQYQFSITGTFDWTTYTITLPNVSTTAKRIDAFCIYLSGTTGTVYFDDASLLHD